MTDGQMVEMTPLRYYRNLHAWGWLGCPPAGYDTAAYPPLLQNVTPGTVDTGGTGGSTGAGGVKPVYRPPLWQNARP